MPLHGVRTEYSDGTTPQWSNEFEDGELGLVYYNYKHCNSACGRWIGKDMPETANSYLMLIASDVLGTFQYSYTGAPMAGENGPKPTSGPWYDLLEHNKPELFVC